MTTTNTTIEEFTFPISHSAAEAFIDSPPLWHHVGPAEATSTSSTSSLSEEEEEEEDRLHSSSIHTNVNQKTLQRKSSSGVGGIRDHHGLVETEGHDRMDLLWEDFNEDPLECNSATTSDDDHSGLSRFGCVPTTLNLSKAVTGGAHGGSAGGGGVVIAKHKKLRVVVLAKVLKRLFLLQHQSVKKRSW